LRLLSEPSDAFPVDPPRSLEGNLVPSVPLDDSLDVFLRAAVELLRHTPGLKVSALFHAVGIVLYPPSLR
jgi:hypothetical protein